MTSKTKEDLLAIAQEWADDLISVWISEYGAWDYTVECEEMTDDDLDWIQNNVKFNINVEEV